MERKNSRNRLRPPVWSLCITARLCCCGQAVGNWRLVVCGRRPCPAGCQLSMACPWQHGQLCTNPCRPPGSPWPETAPRRSQERGGRARAGSDAQRSVPAQPGGRRVPPKSGGKGVEKGSKKGQKKPRHRLLIGGLKIHTRSGFSP